MTSLQKGLLCLGVLGLYFIAASMTYDDQVKEQELFCKLVDEGTYPVTAHSKRVCK